MVTMNAERGTRNPKPEASLGWRILREGAYRIELPPLSAAEEQLVLAAEEKFRLVAGERKIDPADVERELSEAISRKASEELLALDRDQKHYLAKYARMHIYGFAFLDELLADDQIEEISVIGLGTPAYAFVRKEGWKSVNAQFESEKALMDVINRMANSAGRRITLQHPRLDAMLPDGSRLHASLSPVSRGELTIRKFRQNPFSPKEIAALGTADWKQMAFLSMLMQTDSSVLVAGNTASGKTTTLNALFSFVPRTERILITEETPEISVPHAHQVRLVANREMGITLKDLVYDSLRMRPDRMIVGEVRSREEAEALFDVLLGGQARGSYATFHAQSAEEALLRFGKFGILDTDMRSIDAIVVQRRMLTYSGKSMSEARRITEICGVGKGAEPIFSFSGGKWKYCRTPLEERISDSLGLSAKEFASELAARERWLKSAPSDFGLFFEAAQEKLHAL